MFHAERKTTQSNFLIVSTLTEPLSIDDVGVTGFDWPNVNDPNFFSIGSQTDAIESNGSIPLVSVLANSGGNGVRYLFLERRLLLNKGFIVEVGIIIEGSGSSGFSILLHNFVASSVGRAKPVVSSGCCGFYGCRAARCGIQQRCIYLDG